MFDYLWQIGNGIAFVGVVVLIVYLIIRMKKKPS